MLSQTREIDTLLTEAFPDTQGVAEEAVEGQQEAKSELGVRIGENDTWTVEEVVIGTKGHLMLVRQAFGRPRDAGLRLVRAFCSHAPHC